jgi:hypothetical protein
VLEKSGGQQDWNVDDIFTHAHTSEYHDTMLNDNTWNGIHTKGMGSIFQAGDGHNGPPQVRGFEPECWNCVVKHRVDECTQPKDQT